MTVVQPIHSSRTVRFATPKPLTDWMENGRSIQGNEIGGLALSPMALDAHAASLQTSMPCELVVIGEEWDHQGRHFLILGANRAYIEADTDYRHIDGKGLTYVCPGCGEQSGAHLKHCIYRL